MSEEVPVPETPVPEIRVPVQKFRVTLTFQRQSLNPITAEDLQRYLTEEFKDVYDVGDDKARVSQIQVQAFK